MDPWSFGSEGKGLLFPDEMDFPVDAFTRGRKALMEWEIKPSYGFENSGFVSREAAESLEFMELGFPDIMRKHFHANPSEEIYGGEVGCDSSKRVASPTCMITPNSSFGEVESGWKFTGSVVECNSHDSSLIDLKLGRLADGNDANSRFSKERSVLSSGGSPGAAKRARTTSSYNQTAFCQVQGCNMDLSSSKDYHKRHKVCDAHSKTSRVIVNGIEQRFCQQCSRFHLLAEFDDGKRSCRKRLAGHNERRRKPQLDSFSGKSHKFLQSIQGTRFLGSSLPKRTPFVFPDILPGSILYQDKYGEGNQYCHIKFEKDSIYNPQLAIPMMNAPLLGKSFTRLHNIGKQHCSGNFPLDTTSNVQELSGASNSSCALSLLSTQSQDFSSYSAGITMGGTLIFPGGHADHIAGQFSERPLRMSSVEKNAANGFYSSATNPIDVDQMGSMMLSDVTHAVDHFEVEVQAAEGMYQGSGFSNSKHCLSPEHGATVDLLQLSSHLQRVEQQRSSLPVKQENEDLCYFLTT